MSIDFRKAEYIDLNTVFKNICIFPFFFTLLAINLLSNFKLLFFLKRNYLKEFLDKIKEKYKRDFSFFLTKIEKTYFNSKPFDDLSLNYNSPLINSLDNNIVFYTSNICESYIRTLNLRFVGSCKSILIFERCIKEIIEIYKNRNIYQE